MGSRPVRLGAFGAILTALTLLLGACVPRILPPGPDIATPALKSEDFVTADGLKLPVRSWLPADDKPKAIILALHGMNDYSHAFAMPGPWWALHGIATFAYDQRGFGAAPERGYWPGVDALVGDMDAMVKLLHARYPGVPVYLLGESMGAAVVMVGLARPSPPRVAGAILSSPAVWGRDTMDLGKRLALFLAVHTIPWWTVTGANLHITASDNVWMLMELSRDPRVIKETRIDAIWGLVNLMDDALAAAPHLGGVPLLILYGEKDEIIPKEATRTMIDELPAHPAAPRKLAVYRRGYHLLLRDLNGGVVWSDILAWIDDPEAPLPSGADQGARAWLDRK
ncbi:MAG TPA: lysophospholipase [Alphaproteobacteria bacterium]|nr:lysophospholipase [Alphaproteobacteria bacterium]